MNRREFLKIAAIGMAGCSMPGDSFAFITEYENYDDYIRDFLLIVSPHDKLVKDDVLRVSDYTPHMKKLEKSRFDEVFGVWDDLFRMNKSKKTNLQDVLNISDYQKKMKNFNKPHKDDIVVSSADTKTFDSLIKRIMRVQRIVGHGHFQLYSLDDAIKAGKNYSRIGPFSREELKFMETIFYNDASRYGFFGQKTLNNITDKTKSRDVFKVPYTGNYIYRGVPLDMYRQIGKQVGKNATLTSGVRGIMKQFYLFLNKAAKNGKNLSLASRSLAPPGYSFHGNGDFDVGQVGFGLSNFTERFTTTNVFKRLYDLGYLKLRYPEKNYLGVRFEPWHIKTNQV